MNGKVINLISASRAIFGLLFLYVVLFDFNIFYLIVIFALVIAGDKLDGFLARKYNLVTDNGSKIDVICDFSFIMLATLAVALIGLVPFWFLIIIVLKLIEFFVTSGSGALKYDRLGTYVAYTFYVLPLVAVVINSKTITLILTIFISICAIASSILRIKNMRESND